MNRIIKKTIPLLLFVFSIILIPYKSADAQTNIPEKVRIGLYFSYTAKNINTSVSSFTISAEKGLEIGDVFKNTFKTLYEENNSNSITIRKDAYFVRSSSSLTEYNPSESSIPQGVKIGPYHIQIGGNYNDINLVNAEIQKIKQKGVTAFPVYIDVWQIWTGFYVDKNAAQNDIASNLQKKLGAGEYKIVTPAENRIVAESSKGEVLLLYGSSKGVFQIHPRQENNPYVFKINGLSYRGDIEVRRLDFSDMTVINILPLEQYLYGVVPCEIEAVSHPEALKAQAVSARTYTLNSLNNYESFYFDLCTTVYSQVYRGYSAEKTSTNKAIDDTKGKKITYEGRLAQAYYFSSSGGRTEDSKNVWGYDYPYLRSVEDKYESGKSWNYNWQTTFSASDIKRIMKEKSYDLGEILSVTITKTSSAGRAIELVIKGTKGEQVFTNGRCRSALTSLHSQWYNISTDSDAVISRKDSQSETVTLAGRTVMTAGGLKQIKSTKGNIKILGANKSTKALPSIPTIYMFTGKGWGHAIGMSQEGAKGMANAGFTYEQILTHYFQGTKVE